MPPTPIGQTSSAMRSRGDAGLRQTLLEARPLGLRADQADIGEALVGQRGVDQRQVERWLWVITSTKRAGRRAGERLGRIVELAQA